jgi:HlyD family secretion protein
MSYKTITTLLISMLALSCGNGNGNFDASGTFEAEEVIVSAETAGRITAFDAEEGAALQVGQIAVRIDTLPLSLQAKQVDATIASLNERTGSETPLVNTLKQQMQVQSTQIAALEREVQRIRKLVEADAATSKQLDDVTTQLNVAKEQRTLTQKQLDQETANLNLRNRSVLSEQQPLSVRKEQILDQLDRSMVRNPVKGTVLTSYAEVGEVTGPGKALYKIANLDSMVLRAYISGDQLASVKPGQKVKVMIDKNEDEYLNYDGIVSWISDKAEFTPKTIQTKDERAHLVYAMKIRVKNDGAIKIGMYGEVQFK